MAAWCWTNFITTNFGLAQEAETDSANGNRPWPSALTLTAIKIVSLASLDAQLSIPQQLTFKSFMVLSQKVKLTVLYELSESCKIFNLKMSSRLQHKMLG